MVIFQYSLTVLFIILTLVVSNLAVDEQKDEIENTDKLNINTTIKNEGQSEKGHSNTEENLKENKYTTTKNTETQIIENLDDMSSSKINPTSITKDSNKKNSITENTSTTIKTVNTEKIVTDNIAITNDETVKKVARRTLSKTKKIKNTETDDLVIVTVDTTTQKTKSEQSKSDNKRETINSLEKKNVESIPKRFLEDLDYEDWQIAHLKDIEFQSRGKHCKEESFDENVQRYKQALKNDGALVQFVSSDPLPVNPHDLENQLCRTHDDESKTVTRPKDQVPNAETLANVTKTTKSMPKESVGNPQGDTATTAKMKAKSDEDNVDIAGRRNDEYIFPSAEYYEDMEDKFHFTDSTCERFILNIELEVDHIRDYDYRCTAVIMWHSYN